MTNIYGGLSAKDALDLFGKRRKEMAAKVAKGIPLTADEQYEQDGGMTDLAQQNPDAWKLLKVGANYRVDPNDSGEHVRDTFNPSTGEWETKQTKGYWDHPESWMQLAFGGAMGAAGAMGAFGNIGSAASAGGLYGSEFLTPTVAGNAAALGLGGGAAAAGGGTLGTLASSGAINTGIGVAGNLVGGIIQTKAAQKAADEAAAATRYAAELQDAANKRAEVFLREQAENQYANSEASRRGNYDQWRARENRISRLSDTLGAGARDIPDYVAGVDPRYTSSSTTTGDGTGNTGVNGENLPPGSTNPTTNKTQVEPGGASLNVDGTRASISAYFKSRGVPDTETDYWVSKWPELVARGKEINDPNYAMKRLAAADIFGGGGQQTQTPQQNTNTYQTTQYTPSSSVPIAAALSAPDPMQFMLQQQQQQQPMPGSLGYLANRQKLFTY